MNCSSHCGSKNSNCVVLHSIFWLPLLDEKVHITVCGYVHAVHAYTHTVLFIENRPDGSQSVKQSVNGRSFSRSFGQSYSQSVSSVTRHNYAVLKFNVERKRWRTRRGSASYGRPTLRKDCRSRSINHHSVDRSVSQSVSRSVSRSTPVNWPVFYETYRTVLIESTVTANT